MAELTQEQAQKFIELQGRKAEVDIFINALMQRKSELLMEERDLLRQSPQEEEEEAEAEQKAEPAPQIDKKKSGSSNAAPAF